MPSLHCFSFLCPNADTSSRQRPRAAPRLPPAATSRVALPPWALAQRPRLFTVDVRGTRGPPRGQARHAGHPVCRWPADARRRAAPVRSVMRGEGARLFCDCESVSWRGHVGGPFQRRVPLFAEATGCLGVAVGRRGRLLLAPSWSPPPHMRHDTVGNSPQRPRRLRRAHGEPRCGAPERRSVSSGMPPPTLLPRQGVGCAAGGRTAARGSGGSPVARARLGWEFGSRAGAAGSRAGDRIRLSCRPPPFPSVLVPSSLLSSRPSVSPTSRTAQGAGPLRNNQPPATPPPRPRHDGVARPSPRPARGVLGAQPPGENSRVEIRHHGIIDAPSPRCDVHDPCVQRRGAEQGAVACPEQNPEQS